MANTVKQKDLSLILSTTQLIRGFSRDTATIDYWQIDYPKKIVPMDRSSESEERAIYLHVLDWIAQFLVSGPRGDVIAVATSLGTGITPTLYISNNSCKDTEKEIYMKELKSSLQRLINNFFKMHKEQKLATERQIKDASVEFLKQTCEHSWGVVVSKIRRIFNLSYDCTESFQSDICHIYNELKEKIPVTNTTSAAKALTGHWTAICRRGLDAVHTQEDRLTELQQRITSCSKLLSTPIMKYMADLQKEDRARIGLAEKDLAFLGRLYRRTRKVVKFWTGALDFVRDGLERFGKLWDMNKEKKQGSEFKLEVFYVFEKETFQSSIASQIPSVSFTSDKALLAITKIKDDALKDIVDKDRAILAKLDKQLMAITCQGFGCKAMFHCETTLALFLIMSGISVDHNAIGVSKLMCWSCTKFFDKLKTLTQKSFYLSGSSGKSHHAWRYPTTKLFTTPSGLEGIASQFDEASESVGPSAKDELKRVFRSFFPNPPSGPSGVPVPKPLPPSGPSGTAKSATKSNEQQVLSYSAITAKGIIPPEKKPVEKATSSRTGPSSQPKGSSSGETSSSLGLQETEKHRVDPGSDSSEGEISLIAFAILKREANSGNKPKGAKRN